MSKREVPELACLAATATAGGEEASGASESNRDETVLVSFSFSKTGDFELVSLLAKVAFSEANRERIGVPALDESRDEFLEGACVEAPDTSPGVSGLDTARKPAVDSVASWTFFG
jgi:hypothetical protein